MKNTRKSTGSFVWHNDEIKLITNQNVGAFHIVLNNRDKVIRNHVKLVKVGDELEFNDLSALPDRCSTYGVMKVTYFHTNSIGTDKDLYENVDSTHYSHFKRANK